MEYFRNKDRECNMLFGQWQDKNQEEKFSLDMAAAAHRNRLRASNEGIEMTESPSGQPEDFKLERDYDSPEPSQRPSAGSQPDARPSDAPMAPQEEQKEELPKAAAKQTDKYEKFE